VTRAEAEAVRAWLDRPGLEFVTWDRAVVSAWSGNLDVALPA